MEYFGLEGILYSLSSPIPCREQGYLQLDQVAENPAQPDLE